MAKLIVAAATRGEASNRDMHWQLMGDEEFGRGGVDTAYFPRWLERRR